MEQLYIDESQFGRKNNHQCSDCILKALVLTGTFVAFCFVCLLLLILLPIVVGLTLCLRVINIIRGRPQAPCALNAAHCAFFEDEWIQNGDNAFSSSTQSKWIELPGKMETHYLFVPCSGSSASMKDDVPNLILLHGTGSAAALAWSSCVHTLAQTFSIYLPDLPAFGRSTLSWDLFRSASQVELEETYVDWLANYIDAMNLNKPVLVGHSIAGFFSTKFVAKHHEKISKLILVDPAGLLPTLGKRGFYFGWFFKLGIPTRQLRVLGRVATLVLYAINDFMGADAKAYYWLQLHASPTAFGDRVVASFIKIGVNGLTGYWSRPSLRDLLTARVPVAFVYGEADTLMPPEQAQLARSLMRRTSTLAPGMLKRVSRTWHSPMHHSTFTQKLLDAMESAILPMTSDALINNLDASFIMKHPWKAASTFSTTETAKTILGLYDYLKMMGISSDGSHALGDERPIRPFIPSMSNMLSNLSIEPRDSNIEMSLRV